MFAGVTYEIPQTKRFKCFIIFGQLNKVDTKLPFYGKG